MPTIYAGCVRPASSANAKEPLPCSGDVDGRNPDGGQTTLRHFRSGALLIGGFIVPGGI
jgi:hypothetical protein